MMNDNELIEYIKKVPTNFKSHVENGNVEMSLEYYNLCEELMARGINAIQENQQLKEQQKEFIGYLEKEIVDCRAGSSQYYSAIEHLKLYNKVIGGDK